MAATITVRRVLAAIGTLGVFGVIVGMAALTDHAGRGKAVARLPQPQTASARTWPMFGGSPQRNMVNLMEKNLPTDWCVEAGKQKNIKWVADLGSKAHGGPVVADGKVFIGTNNEKPRDPQVKGDRGILLCFEEKTGKFLWQHAHEKLPAGMVQDWPKEGICSTPVIEGETLWYVSNRCEVICSTTAGRMLWKLDMIGQLGVFPHNMSACSPLVVGDTVFVVTSNGVDEGHVNIPAPQAPSFLAVHKRTGKVLWQDNSPTAKLLLVKEQGKERQKVIQQLVNQGELLAHAQWSNPTHAEVAGQAQVIFPGGDGWLRAFEPNSGRLLWKFDCNPKSAAFHIGGRGTRNDFIATPVVHGHHLYIGLGQDPEHDEGIGHFWCIDLARAVVKGRTNKYRDVSPINDNFDPNAPINKDSALAWHYGEPSNPKWKVGRRYVFGRTMSTAAVHDGLVYVAELAGYLHCLDAMTGQQYWTHNTRSAIWSAPYWADDKVYLGNDNEEVLVFQHGRQKRLLNQMDMEGKLRIPPVAANGVLFIATENKLYAIASGK